MSITLNIATFQGDGIGPDVINSAIEIIEKASNAVGGLNFEWNFIWAFNKGKLFVEPPLGRALIKDALERYLVKSDYKLESGGDYIFTVRAKF